MPKRPRQHQLETESRIAFRSRLPSRWVMRDLDQDYGIDAQVEIFDKDDLATGLTFLVQLKSTDREPLESPPVIRFSRDKAEYYWSLDLPVLIVLYHSPTDRIFIKWVHSWDTHNETKTEISCTFTFEPNSEWKDSNSDEIIATLTELRIIRSPRLAKPFIVDIICPQLQVHEFELSEIVASLRANERKVGTWLQFSGPNSTSATSQTQLFLSDERLSVTLAGMHGTTFHTPEGYPGTRAELVHDIFVAIGLALHWHGHSHEGAQLISEYVGGSKYIRSSESAVTAAQALAAGGRISNAIELFELLFEVEETWELGFMCYHGISHYLFLPETPKVDRINAAQALTRVAHEIRESNPLQAATVFYNAANIWRGLNEFRRSVRMYHRALQTWPEYGDRGYFNEELAGLLFELRRYHLSSSLYSKALEQEDTSGLRGRLADALFFAGKYDEATLLWENCSDNAEWILKYECAKYLTQTTGLSNQTRDPLAAKVQDDPAQALQLDALDPRAWWNHGHNKMESGDFTAATLSFLLSAFSSQVNKEALLNAIACAHRDKEATILAGILAVGSRWFGHEFLTDYLGRIDGEKTDEFRKHALEALNLLPNDRESGLSTLRLHLRDPQYDIITTKVITLDAEGKEVVSE